MRRIVPHDYDAILVIGFGGPEKREDVIPFLENVLRGKPVPRERMLEVAEHYYHFDGVSPINDQVRDLLDVLGPELKRRGITQPVYWGNRNWHPMLDDTVAQMKADGHQRAVGLVLAGYSSYSSCRQYRENVSHACEAAGEGAPIVDKLRVFYNHPLWIEANADCLAEAIQHLPEEGKNQFHIAFTAHSIPNSMADHCRYEAQLQETCRLVSEAAGVPDDRWKLVFQSRSGRPTDPWLEPDICDHIEELHSAAVRHVVIMPIGFLSDHMEVLFDLDEEAAEKCGELGIEIQRAKTVGTHPKFVEMLGDIIEERIRDSPDRRAIGQFPASHDVCPVDCCPAPARPKRPAATSGDQS